MKHNFFFKLLIVIAFFSLTLTLTAFSATPVYLSSTGNDSNDGLSVVTPKATLTAAMSLVDAGGTIIVSGTIDMWSDPGNTTFTPLASGNSTTNKTGVIITKSLIIQGASTATDGFTGTNGSNSTRIFQVTNAAHTLTLKNLKLANAKINSTLTPNGPNGGAINMSTGNIVAENVVFDSNVATGHSAITGAAIQIGTTATSTFKNCVFYKNISEKTGAIYINDWTSSITFEGCSFIENESKTQFGGSALFIRAASNNNTLSLINCTIAKNKVTTAANGGTIYVYKGSTNTNINIINCTITANTQAGNAGNGAGVYYLNSTGNAIANLYIKNSIIEGNTAASAAQSDLSVAAISPATSSTSNTLGYVKIQNSFIGKSGTTSTNVPAGNIENSSYNYVSTAPTDYKAKFSTFNTTYNCYPLLTGSSAFGYGLKSYLTSLSPTVTTDQIGNSRTQATACDAGAIEVPRVSITSTSSATTSDNPIPVTITFSNAVTGFDASDITVSNGTKGTLSGSGTTYTMNITPTAAGTVTVDIAANAATDAVGNGNVAATQFTRTYALAGTPPTVSISSTTTSNTDVSPIPITITFSESVTGFDVTDLSISNGSASNFAGSGTTYTANITPAGQGNVTVDIAANAAVSVSSSTGNAVATQFVRTYDTSTPPSVTISSATLATTKSNPIPISITFSESVTGFVVGDLTVGNGTASNFAGSGTTYTADITPTASGTVTVDIAANAATGATKGNTVAIQLSRTYYKDIYLSSSGNDANNGLTEGTAVASFSRAQTLAASGETIYVSGLIDFSTDPANTASPKLGILLAKSLTIQGSSNANDGFDGKNVTRFINQSTSGSYNLTIKDVKLINGATLTYTNGNGGALQLNGATLNCQNVIFDSNTANSNNLPNASPSYSTGGAIHINSVNSATFTNCIFSNNSASKTGAIYVNNWAASSTIKFEGCAFKSNIVKDAFGGSAVFIRTTNDNNTISFVNCTFAKNEVRSTASGGTIYVYQGNATTVTNIINCTVSENTTAGTASSGAGVYFKNSTPDIYSGKLYIRNSIIEGNKAASNAYSDFSSSDAPTTTTLQINNCLIGKQGSTAVIPSGCFGETNQYNYLTSASTTNAYKGGLAPYNSTSNVYPLYSGSLAIDYGASTYLTSLSPTVTTDQLGNVRTVAATNYAGAWESTPIATTTPLAPTSLVATAGDGQASIAFTTANTGGSNITNYKYSTDGTNFVACSPVKTTSPIVITGLTNTTAYAIKLKAVNVNGDGAESAASNSVTPDATANDIPVSTAINVSTLALTPVSDLVVSSNVLTINQATTVNSITVAPGAKITVNGTNALTATNGITLESDATGTATIVDSYATPTLSATVKQYVTAGRNWYLSPSVSASGLGALSLGNSVVEWNEATKVWDTKSTGNLVAGKGYIQVANASQGTTGTVNFSGLTNSGEIPVTVSRTESGSSRGFNLVGNPYPSYIDWNDVIADSENAAAGLNTSFWYRTKNTLGAFVFTTYNGTSNEVVGGTTANTTINNLIPPMQAFWIKVNENVGVTTHNTTLKFKNTMREHGVGDNNKFKAPKADNRLRLRLKLENGSVSDETLIYFDTNASDGFDNYDSPKMLNNSTSTPDLYSKSGTERLVINGLSELRNNIELPLGFSLSAAASLKLQVSELTNLPTNTRVYLLDKVENTQTELVENAAYGFNTTSATSNNESRFSLLFRVPGVTTGMDNATKINTQVFLNAANYVVIVAPVKSNYAIYNAMGQQVTNGVTNSNYQTANTKLAAGMYIVKVGNNSTRVIAP